MSNNKLRKLIAASIMISAWNFTPEFHNISLLPVAHAAVETYEGVGEYMVGSKDTHEFAIETAKKYAERDAQEQAGLFLSSQSIAKNSKLQKDEIVTITAGVMKVIAAPPQAIPIEGGFVKYRVTVKAQIDTDLFKDEVVKWLKRNSQEKSNIVAQDVEQQKLIESLQKRVKDLENQLKNNKNNTQVQEQIKAIDKDAEYAQKVDEANKQYYKQNYAEAEKIYKEAIKSINGSVVRIEIATGEYILSDYETRNDGQLRSKLEAENSIKSRYNAALKGYLMTANKTMTENKIATIVDNIIMPVDLQWKINLIPVSEYSFDTKFEFEAKAKVKIDENKVSDFFNRNNDEQMILVDQWKSLAQMYTQNDDEVKNLRKLAANIKTYRQAEEKNIPAKFKRNSNELQMLSNIDTGNKNYYSGKYSEAIIKYNEALKIDSNSWLALMNRGNAYRNLKDYNNALADLNKAIQLNPKGTMIYFSRSLLYQAMGNNTNAQADLKQAKSLGLKI